MNDMGRMQQMPNAAGRGRGRSRCTATQAACGGAGGRLPAGVQQNSA